MIVYTVYANPVQAKICDKKAVIAGGNRAEVSMRAFLPTSTVITNSLMLFKRRQGFRYTVVVQFAHNQASGVIVGGREMATIRPQRNMTHAVSWQIAAACML